MATGFRTIPSAIAQQAALAQLREIQNPNLALERELQKAMQLQQMQQQSPEGQLALQLKQAQLAQIPLQAQRQQYELDALRQQLDPNYQAAQDARKLALDVNRATQIANATSKGKKGFFDVNSGRWIEEVDGRPVAFQIPLSETLEQVAGTPVALASDIPSIDPTLFSGTTVIPTAPAPTRRTLAGTLDQRAKNTEDLKKEEQDFRKDLQERSQTFTAEQNKLQREYLQGKDAAKPVKFSKADEVTTTDIAKENAKKISILNQLISGAETFRDPKISDEVKVVEGARLGKILNSTEGKDALQEAERNALLPFLNFEIGNPKGLFDPARKVFGRNLPAFEQQLNAAAGSVNRAIDYNNRYINGIYQKYGQSYTPDSVLNISTSQGGQANTIQREKGESTSDFLKRKYNR